MGCRRPTKFSPGLFSGRPPAHLHSSPWAAAVLSGQAQSPLPGLVQSKPSWVTSNIYNVVSEWTHWRGGGEQNEIPASGGRQPTHSYPKAPGHTLALFSLMSSGPRLPAPEGAGSPTSSCHGPKAPRALFTRHFLTGERSKRWHYREARSLLLHHLHIK